MEMQELKVKLGERRCKERRNEELIQCGLSQISESKKTKLISNPKEVKMLKKSVPIVVMALFVFSFIAVAAVSADETQEITGTVDSFNPVTKELTIKDDAGDVKKLMTGPDIDMESLKNLKPGDSVNVEADSKGVIKSLVTE